MENFAQLLLLVAVFMALWVVVAYVADGLACWFLRWMRIEGTDETPCVK